MRYRCRPCDRDAGRAIYERDRLSGKHQLPPVYKGPPKHRRGGDGKVVTSHGYVLVYVGKGHPEANCNGFAYEHRLVAARAAVRMLVPGEEVHHEDEDKGNNSSDNLEICPSHAEHAFRHRSRDDLRRPGEENSIISCGCGCGERFEKYDETGRPRRFISGHHAKAFKAAPARDSLVALFEVDSARRITVSDVATHVGCSRTTAGAILCRATDAGYLVRVERGLYVMADAWRSRIFNGDEL